MMVRDYFNNHDDLEPVSREELLARAGDGAVVILDLRPPRRDKRATGLVAVGSF